MTRMQCEMCGADASLKQTRVEGIMLKLCNDCQETGEVVEKSDSNQKNKQTTSSTSSRRSDDPIERVVKNLGDKVKAEREDRDLSMQQLGDELGVKTSVVRRVENEDLTPDKQLAKKLNKTLDITVYETHRAVEVDTVDDSDAGEATIGDVATVRKRD